MDAAPYDNVTLRKVAAELDTGPASLYVYFRNAEELHAAVLEHYLGSLDLPVRAPDGSRPRPWRQGLVALLTQYTRVLFDRPQVARMAAFTRPSGPNYLRLLETLLDLLIEGGLRPADAAWGIDLLLLHATTHAVEQGARHAAGHGEEDAAILAEAVHDLVRENSPDHPRLVALGDELFSGEGEERLAWGFEVLIAGLLTTHRPDLAPPPSAAT